MPHASNKIHFSLLIPFFSRVCQQAIKYFSKIFKNLLGVSSATWIVNNISICDEEDEFIRTPGKCKVTSSTEYTL